MKIPQKVRQMIEDEKVYQRRISRALEEDRVKGVGNYYDSARKVGKRHNITRKNSRRSSW